MTTPDETPETGSFADFGLDPAINAAVAALGFNAPTPIQARAIPTLMSGVDIVGRARTGSGKTAAFGLPLLHHLKDGGPLVKAVVLTPTRELALQVTGALRGFATGLPLRILTIYGGTGYGPQIRALKSGVSVVVATPGRLLDLMDKGVLDLSFVEILVLDEADEMLRMGFIDDVKRVFEATPEERQVALFSATMPKPMRAIARAYLKDPVEVQVESHGISVDHITQRHILVPQRNKLDALIRVLTGIERGTTLVFSRTRNGAATVADELTQLGMAADALHGDLAQSARERVLHRLRGGRLDVLVATDVASRGIDVEHITHVINLDLPPDTESYVHRIGRTGRAGRVGNAIAFVTPGERRRLRNLERDLKVHLTPMTAPSDADIARRERNRLGSTLTSVLTPAATAEGAEGAEAEAAEVPALTEERALLAALLEDSEHTIEDLAAAALRRLAEARGVTLGAIPKDAPPPWSRSERKSQDRRQQQGGPGGPGGQDTDNNAVELFFPIGRFHGVRPGDLVGALANEAGIPGREIGRVTIVDRKSFVGLTRPAAEHVVANLPILVVRGIEVTVKMAHHPGRPTGRRPFRKGYAR